MRLFLSSVLTFLFSVVCLVQAKSAVGDRILVVLEDGGEKNAYSQFWADLEGECCSNQRYGVFRGLTEDVLQHEISS
jgi:hypothetical protein